MTEAEKIVEKIIAENRLDSFSAAIVRMRAWNNPQEARRLAESMRPEPKPPPLPAKT